MSEDRSRFWERGEEFVSILKKGAEFTKELIRENERLRMEVARLQGGSTP